MAGAPVELVPAPVEVGEVDAGRVLPSAFAYEGGRRRRKRLAKE